LVVAVIDALKSVLEPLEALGAPLREGNNILVHVNRVY
jgi:hypothetical protein